MRVPRWRGYREAGRTDAIFSLSAPRGGEGRGEVGVICPRRGVTHLTLARWSLSSGRARRGPVGRAPLPLSPLAGGEGKRAR